MKVDPIEIVFHADITQVKPIVKCLRPLSVKERENMTECLKKCFQGRCCRIFPLTMKKPDNVIEDGSEKKI